MATFLRMLHAVMLPLSRLPGMGVVVTAMGRISGTRDKVAFAKARAVDIKGNVVEVGGAARDGVRTGVRGGKAPPERRRAGAATPSAGEGTSDRSAGSASTPVTRPRGAATRLPQDGGRSVDRTWPDDGANGAGGAAPLPDGQRVVRPSRDEYVPQPHAEPPAGADARKRKAPQDPPK